MERKEEVKLGGAAMSLPADLSCLQGGGGAEDEAALAALEKQLICPICLELFNKPVVILPCQHNLCRKCANELYQPSLLQARTTMMVNSGRFRCPTCRHEVVLDRHGVYGLQRNLLVENIIDVYKQEVSNNSRPLPPPPAAAQLTCSDHEGEKVNIYCLTCQVPTCSLCKVFGAHQACQVAPLTDIYQQQRDELSEEVTSLVSVNDKVQALIDGLEETCRNIEDNCRTQKQSVCEKFSRVFSILEERRKAMTQRISAEEEEKTGHAQALVRCYGDSVAANSKLVERAASSMEEPDMAAFVQNSRELITKVLAATSCCPAETLKPGYENMSRYRFNFSRQERALRSMDFLKVVEDVPEEPEVEQEPEEPTEFSVQDLEQEREEPTEFSVQDLEQEHHQETSTQTLDSVPEPVKEPVEPAQTPAPTSAPLQPAPGPVRAEPAGADLQPQTDDLDLSDGGQMKEEEEEEEEEQTEEVEGCADPDPVKEGNICEQQEGMSTQQCEGGEAGRDAGDWTPQSETEEKHDAQDEEDEVQMKETLEATFYPGWYKANSWRRVSSAPAEILPKVDDTEQTMTEGSPSEARTQTEARGAVQAAPEPPKTQEQSMSDSSQASTELGAQPDRPLPRLPDQSENQSPLHESQSQPQKVPVELADAFTPDPRLQLTLQAAREAATTEEEPEEEDMQGWVCLPGVDKSFSLAEGSFDLEEDRFSDNNDPASKPPEETRSGLERGSSGADKDIFKLSDESVEDAEEKEHLEEDILHLKCASEQREIREGDFQAERTNEKLEKGSVQENDVSGLEQDAEPVREESWKPANDRLAVGDRGVSRTSSSIRGAGAGEETEEGGESSKQPERSAAETVSLQTETRSPAQTSPPSSSSSSSALSEAPRRPSFCFSWLNPLHKKK